MPSDCPLRGDGAEDPLFHPLQQPRALPHPPCVLTLRRYSRLGLDDATNTVSIPTTATSTGHGRCPAGCRAPRYIVYGPLANGATTDVRGHPDLPRRLPLLGVIDKHKVTSSNISSTPRRPPSVPDGGGRRTVKKTSQRASLRSYSFVRRADQPGGLGVVITAWLGQPLPQSSTLVQTEHRGIMTRPAGRHAPQARLRHPAILRVGARGVDGEGQCWSERPLAI